MTIRLISLNVNGIRDNNKRRTIFFWLKEQEADLYLLQETHCESQNDINNWSHEWGGEAFWSLGTNYAKGVAILIKPNLDIKIKNPDFDTHGRHVAVNIEIDDFVGKIINIYAPNNPKDRKKFVRDLKLYVEEYTNAQPENDEVIIGGDFNCTLDVVLDRRYEKRKNNRVPDEGTKELLDLLTDCGLEDIWRRRCPNTKRYTYFKANSLTASRIDYWLVSKSLDPMITNTKILQAVRSDHSAIQLTVKTNNQERGPGYWKLSNGILKTETFDNTFKAFWQGWKNEIDNFTSPKEWWELTKMKIKNLSMQVAKEMSKHRKIEESKLQKKLEIEKHLTDPNTEKISFLETQLKNLWDTKAEGARLRARITNFEQGEKSSKYFYNLEKIRGRNKLWNQIKDENGKIKQGLENIMNEQVKFYSKLLSSEGWDKNAANELLKNVHQKISDDDRKLCEEPISESEVSAVIKSLKPEKSPGQDGITAEFYKLYWPVIKDEFMFVIREIENDNCLCYSQYRGIISLLYKQGDRDDIKNWRPITLLNLDYKIIAKVYAERLKKVLPSVIHTDQKAFLTGRQITESVRLIQDIIETADLDDEPGAIIFVDQQKAFDRIEWGYLDLCLKKYGFGPKFCNCISMLYKHGQSCINTNGFLSKYFSISRSMRQGCPIAAYLYILQAEPMAQAVRSDDKIEGIELPAVDGYVSEARIAIFADDTQLFHRSEKSIKRGFGILKTYCRASGAKLNMSKTKGLYIGRWKEKNPEFKEIKWVKSVTGLGAKYGYNIDYDEIWMEKFSKFKEKIKQWTKRDLTLKGKKLLINSYVMSNVSYLTDIYTQYIPPVFISSTRDLIRDFLWGGNTWRVAQKTTALRHEHGGLEIPDLESFIKSKRIMWLLRIHFSETDKWNAIGKNKLATLNTQYNTNNFLLKCSSLKTLNLNHLPQFYKVCLNSWAENMSKRVIDSKEDILHENLFGNYNIKINKNPLFLPHWAQSNLKQVKDVWDTETNGWKPAQMILQELQRKTNWIAEFNSIKRAIPQRWKTILQGQNPQITEKNDLFCNATNVSLTDEKIMINNSDKNLCDIKLKEVYFDCLYPLNKPTCLKSWNKIFEDDLDWNRVSKGFINIIQGRKQIDFHWRLAHRAIYSEMRLLRMGRSNGICKICMLENEDLCHLIYDCANIQNLWEMIQQKLTLLIEIDIPINRKIAIFGSLLLTDIKLNFIQHSIINHIIYETQWQIWKNRNSVKYGQRVALTPVQMYERIIERCKYQCTIFIHSQGKRVLKDQIKKFTDNI